jgi:hypothetical protein
MTTWRGVLPSATANGECVKDQVIREKSAGITGGTGVTGPTGRPVVGAVPGGTAFPPRSEVGAGTPSATRRAGPSRNPVR